ncbi:MAG: preprotein translocase subunit SecE [Psychromonas sp.]|nr:preprotein translocase subunit SecE [Psychromonas sp.]
MKTIEEEQPASSFDGIKWTISVLLLITVVVGNFLFEDQINIVLRVVIVSALIFIALFIAAFTSKGKTFIEFAQGSRTEVRKVVWPTRQETVQTTLIVIAVSILVGLVLWGLDGIFVRVIEYFTMAI